MGAARIGIRELREGLSRALRRVRAGEPLEVTDRGRPVARIVPIVASNPALDHLIADGELHPARARGPLPPPLELPSRMSAEEAVRVLRGD